MKTYIRKIDERWYAYGCRNYTVYSIGADKPDDGYWYGNLTDGGIKYVSTASPNRAAAVKKARRAGSYCGEW